MSKEDAYTDHVEIGAVQMIKGDDIPFVGEGLSARTIYADAIKGGTVLPQTSKFNLVEHRTDQSDEKLKAVHVCTLVIPSAQIRSWADFLSKIATTYEKALKDAGEA